MLLVSLINAFGPGHRESLLYRIHYTATESDACLVKANTSKMRAPDWR
jgi:hypothetical protein